MKKQTNYFLIGLIFLIFAMLSVTIIPILFKLIVHVHIQKYIYIQFEFFALVASSVFFLFFSAGATLATALGLGCFGNGLSVIS